MKNLFYNLLLIFIVKEIIDEPLNKKDTRTSRTETGRFCRFKSKKNKHYPKKFDKFGGQKQESVEDIMVT